MCLQGHSAYCPIICVSLGFCRKVVKVVINWVILDYFRWPNFKIFFNHGEGMEYTFVINWVIQDSFRWSNFKIFFNHREGMKYTLVINWIILDYFKWTISKFSSTMVKEWNILVINWVLNCFRWSNFKIFFNHGEGMEYTLVINWVILECFRYENSI